MFPMIGEFVGVEQQGNGSDRLDIDSKFNVKYIDAGPFVETRKHHAIDQEEQVSATQLMDDHYDRVS